MTFFLLADRAPRPGQHVLYRLKATGAIMPATYDQEAGAWVSPDDTRQTARPHHQWAPAAEEPPPAAVAVEVAPAPEPEPDPEPARLPALDPRVEVLKHQLAPRTPGSLLTSGRPPHVNDRLEALAETPGLTLADYERGKAAILAGQALPQPAPGPEADAEGQAPIPDRPRAHGEAVSPTRPAPAREELDPTTRRLLRETLEHHPALLEELAAAGGAP